MQQAPERSWQIQWEIPEFSLHTFKPYCYGCGEIFHRGEQCATIRIQHEAPLRFHQNCLSQFVTGCMTFLEALEGEGKPN